MPSDLTDTFHALQVEEWICTARNLQLVVIGFLFSVGQHHSPSVGFAYPFQFASSQLTRTRHELEHRPGSTERIQRITALGRDVDIVGRTCPNKCFLRTFSLQFFAADLHLYSFQVAQI